MSDGQQEPSVSTSETESGMKVITINPGRSVNCDDCNGDFTDSKESGGIHFCGRALCPACAPKWEKVAKENSEERFITARCPEGMSFADWVRDVLRA